MGNRTVDSTKQKLGDTYHYLVVIEVCLNALSGDTVLIESLGDITTDDEQVEVKHHVDEEHKIGDGHRDFWKTLANWVENWDDLSNKKALILHTTSSIRESSRLNAWNDVSGLIRFKILKDITGESKSEELKKYSAKIFDFSGGFKKDDLVQLLEKVSLRYDELRIHEYFEKILDHVGFASIPASNRPEMVKHLLGQIVAEPIQPPHSWEIEVSDFHRWIQRYSPVLMNKARMPSDYENEPLPDDADFGEYRFVKELQVVNLKNEIPEAMLSYYRTNQTICLLCNDELIPENSIELYKKDILRKMEYLKKDWALDAEGASVKVIILASKKCYYKCMNMPAGNVEGIEEVRPFFKEGVVHHNVNDTDYQWRISGQ